MFNGFPYVTRRIYCDAASTTPLSRRARRAMRKTRGVFGNPSSIHKEGVRAQNLLRDLRARVAKVVGMRSSEIIFTSTGTESNNIAINGFVETLVKQGVALDCLHVITSALEHSSVLKPLHELEGKGLQVTYLGGAPDGVIREQDVKQALTKNTALVVLSYVNSEIGTISYIQKIGAYLRAVRLKRIEEGNEIPLMFHLDASQAPLYLPLDAERLYVDSMTIDGHKICGPKGVACLAVRDRITLSPIAHGGGQEKGLHSGTESIELIAGFTVALEEAARSSESRSKKISAVRDELARLISVELPRAIINGSLERRVANNLNISIPGIDPEFTVLKMDVRGVAVSTKSSCLKDEEKSYVVYSISKDHEQARTTLRFTFLPNASVRHAHRLFKVLKQVVHPSV